jgi:hypothetical protein
MQGNILITVLIVLALVSISTLYSARESLWAVKLGQTEKDTLQLDMFVDEALLKAEQLIKNLPIEITPVEVSQCVSSPCVLLAQEAHFFLEQPLLVWLADHNLASMALVLSQPHVQGWVTIEHLSTVVEADDTHWEQYFRTSVLLLTQNQQAQLRMQATWKKATLKSDIMQVDSLIRLSLR